LSGAACGALRERCGLDEVDAMWLKKIQSSDMTAKKVVSQNLKK
jgi:hypothetical protein